MNKTNWEHAVVAAVITIVITVTACNFMAPSYLLIILCALPGVFFFAGREHAQQSTWLKKQWGRPIDYAITIEALKIWEWDRDSQLDFLFPLFAVFVSTPIFWWIYL